jgi:hypothetical protein
MEPEQSCTHAATSLRRLVLGAALVAIVILVRDAETEESWEDTVVRDVALEGWWNLHPVLVQPEGVDAKEHTVSIMRPVG